MSRSLARTGIALIAASLTTVLAGPAAFADGNRPVLRQGWFWHGHGHRRAPMPVRRRAALRPGCKRVQGGMACVNGQGFTRDWGLNDIRGDRDPVRSAVGDSIWGGRGPVRSALNGRDE